ncbi:MAG: type I 3-dehydroquinate dehydratase [Desulfobacteraceae bacterium]|nr:MAG: type I 3-dehydroquinate dehydratase [Desulfobacteraceae bacterium]
MHALKTEIEHFDQALVACLHALSAPAASVPADLGKALHISFLNLGRLLEKVPAPVDPLICAAIMAPNTLGMQAALNSAAADADLLEIRLDALDRIEIEKLLPFALKPIIVTNRKKEEGGCFPGTEPERLAALRTAVDLGADYIDLEYRTPEPLRSELLHQKKTTGIILSYHDMRGTPGLPELRNLWQDMTRIRADYYKIVCTGRHLEDNLTLLHFLKEIAPPEPGIICHAMGSAGLVSRILAPFFGSRIVYVAPAGGTRTAPGQLEAGPIKQLWDILRL